MGNTQQKQKYINDIQTKNYNIYKIFNINENNYTWDELKINYKKLAIKTHPDKGGDKFLFDFIDSMNWSKRYNESCGPGEASG